MPIASIILGGKAWHLRYEMNALAELEGALKMTIEEIGLRLKRGRFGTRECRALVWAGLLHAEEELSIRQVGTWLTEAGFLKNDVTRQGLLEQVFEALALAFPEAVKATKDAEDKDPN